MMNTRLFTIVICTYNGGTRIGKVLDNILSQDDLNADVSKIVVVDNNSNDNTKEVISRYYDRIIPVEYVYEAKPGLSFARKAGVMKVDTQWTVFLDDDNYITPNWIKAIHNYAIRNKNVGSFNGAVIPCLEFEADEIYKKRLNSSYKVLACTHLNVEELEKRPYSPFRNPIGAGMIVLTASLKDLINRGWLEATGRTKDNLASGEDGEMAFWVKNQGYDFGFCKDAILYHGIPKSRLEDDYLRRMWYEIGKGVAVVVKKHDKTHTKRYIYYVLKCLQNLLIIDSFKKTYLNIYLKGYKDGI